MRFILLLFALTLSTALWCQENVRFIEAGPQFTYHTSLDKGMSPVQYRGPSGGMWLGSYRDKKGVTEVFRLQGQYGSATATHKAANANRFHLQFDYHLLIEVDRWQTPIRTTKIGGSWLTLAGMRQHTGYSNNNYNFEIATGPALSGQSAWGLHFLKRDWWLVGSIHLPLISATQRPAFAYGGPSGFYDEEKGIVQQLLSSTRIASWGSFQRILTQWHLQYPLKNGNRVGLSYQWDLYRLTNVPTNAVSVGNHTLSLITYFNY